MDFTYKSLAFTALRICILVMCSDLYSKTTSIHIIYTHWKLKETWKMFHWSNVFFAWLHCLCHKSSNRGTMCLKSRYSCSKANANLEITAARDVYFLFSCKHSFIIWNGWKVEAGRRSAHCCSTFHFCWSFYTNATKKWTKKILHILQ